MSSKKLSAEVDRVIKELRQQMEIYDEKWQQLKNLCALSAVMSSTAPEEKNSGLKAKKKVGNRPQSVESIDQRSVQDQISRLKNELEAAHKRLYKYRQQMELYANNPDLKNTGKSAADLLLLKKDIERRGKRGKVFFLRGVSSEVDDGQNMTLESEAVEWISSFLTDLSQQSDKFQAELEEISSGRQTVDPARSDQIRAMLELHRLHMSRLEDILRVVQNKTINRKGHPYDRVKEEIAATNFVAGVEEEDDGTTDFLSDIRDALEPYVHDNGDMSYIVAEEIYDQLTAVDFSDVAPVDESPSPSVKSVPPPPPKSPSVSKSNSISLPAPAMKSMESLTTASSPVSREKPVKPCASPPRPNAWSHPMPVELGAKDGETPVSGRASSDVEKVNEETRHPKPAVEDETTDIDELEITYKPGVVQIGKGPGLIRLRVSREGTEGEENSLLPDVHAVSICRWVPTDSLQKTIARDVQMLTVDPGQVYQVFAFTNTGWSCGRCRSTGQTGWFPSCAVSVLGSKVIMKLQLLKNLAAGTPQ